MSIESQADRKGLKRAAEVARITLDALTKQVQPGFTTGKLDDTAARLLAAHCLSAHHEHTLASRAATILTAGTA